MSGPWDQAEAAEQSLLGRGQVVVGQVERGRDGQVLGPHHSQPVAGRRQLGGQARRVPGRVVPELAGEHPDRQRQVPAQPGELAPGGVRAVNQVGPASQPGQQRAASRGVRVSRLMTVASSARSAAGGW